MLEVIILSIIQGVTEFLPISSSAHLILVSEYFNFNNQNLTLDVSLHFGSLLAIIFYFKKELLDFVNNKKLFFKIILSCLPVMIFGFLLIKKGVFEQIHYPWFEPTYLEIKDCKDFSMEDVTLCLKLSKLNIPIHVHPEVVVGHFKQIEMRI